MRIAVIGAGIGGLVAAAGLQNDGHEVSVFEQRAEPSRDGAGLTLFGNALEALDLIGLGDIVRAVSTAAVASMRAGQRQPSGSWLVQLPSDSIASMRGAHRVDLHQELSAHLAPGTVRTGTPARASQDGAPAVAVGQRTEEFDVVVVADGIHSRNRRALGLDTGLRYTGCTAWRGVTAGPVDLHDEAGETWGRGQVFGMVPIPGGVYWFGTLNAPPGTVFADDHEAARAQFAGWHASIRECMSATPPNHVVRHDVYELARIPASFTRGRTVLLGDAAHAMTPNLGQGAGQAIEDAATLVLLLRDRKADDVDAALLRYSRLRRRRTAAIWRRSRMLGRIAQASNPVVVQLRDLALRLTPRTIVGAMTRSILSWPIPG